MSRGDVGAVAHEVEPLARSSTSTVSASATQSGARAGAVEARSRHSPQLRARSTCVAPSGRPGTCGGGACSDSARCVRATRRLRGGSSCRARGRARVSSREGRVTSTLACSSSTEQLPLTDCASARLPCGGPGPGPGPGPGSASSVSLGASSSATLSHTAAFDPCAPRGRRHSGVREGWRAGGVCAPALSCGTCRVPRAACRPA